MAIRSARTVNRFLMILSATLETTLVALHARLIRCATSLRRRRFASAPRTAPWLPGTYPAACDSTTLDRPHRCADRASITVVNGIGSIGLAFLQEASRDRA